MKNNVSLQKFILLSFATIFFASCLHTPFSKKERNPKDIIKLSLLCRKNSKNNWIRPLKSFKYDKTFYISRFPLITTTNIAYIRLIPAKEYGKSYLELHFDTHGRYLWTQVSAEYRRRLLLLTLDKQPYGKIEVKKFSEGGLLLIKIPFENEIAKRISENAKLNYEEAH
ncbi:MAG: hypothetical protein U9O87_00250 [Verrucomicrobiota bacterium]|nr:hypothetical protein [Verrucomicrobiota bacterium]